MACTPDAPSASKKQTKDTIPPAPVAESAPVAVVNDSLDQLANYIAGIDTTGTFSNGAFMKSYKNFCSKFENRWNTYQKERIEPLTQFAKQQLDSVLPASKTVFYPFSGPDILYPMLFFPNKDRYVLVGLEPVGSLPDFREDSVVMYYDQLYNSLNAILKFSFFRTESMQEDLHNEDLDGTIHVLLLFLKRMNHKIVAIQRFGIDSAGQKMLSTIQSPPLDAPVQGLKIDFIGANNQLQTLEYVSANIADYSLNAKKGLKNYLNAIEHPITYLKGASYLLHKPTFKGMRELILNKSDAVVEDDSGVPVKYFMNDDWSLRLYGSYSKPISMFAKHYQSDLDSLYKTRGAMNLKFGLGYNYKDKNSNFLVARRKQS
jgi:hypothetical protein